MVIWEFENTDFSEKNLLLASLDYQDSVALIKINHFLLKCTPQVESCLVEYFLWKKLLRCFGKLQVVKLG